jgi:hypothetical protein
VTAVAAVAAAVVAGSLFPHLQFVPCEFNIIFFLELQEEEEEILAVSIV